MRLIIAGCLAVLFLACGSARAQGIIVPGQCERCPPRPIPLPRPIPPRPLPRVLKVKSVKLTASIDSQVATTKVEQVFENDTPYRLEGTYFFPLPDSASVSDFAIYDGEKRMSGEVIDKAKARQIYESIVRRARDPGLLEYAGKNLLEADVFPIEPMSRKKIELAYSQVLKADGGTVSYNYPLGSGRNLLVQPIEQIAGSIEIKSPVDLKNIYSPSHEISVSRDGDRRARLSFESNGRVAQSDFRLYYSLSDKDFGLSLLTNREPAKDGYFLMLLSPKSDLKATEREAKDIIFVLDTSGSMSGEKIDKAKSALRFGVDSLFDDDRFNIVSFSGEEHLMATGLVPATKEGKQKGRAFIEHLRAEGGTNINDALVTALKQLGRAGSTQMVVMITDGLPTVGITDINKISDNVVKENAGRARLFCFGVGYDVNTALLDKLSLDNKGATDYIEPAEDLEVKVSSFFAKVNYPVLTDLHLDLGGVETELVYPKTLPDLFKGSQLVLIGRYKGSARNATVRLKGKIGGKERSFSFDGQTFPEETLQNDFLPRLWATRRIGYLLEQIRLNGENRELVDEITSLGTRYGIVTPYTSFLITEDAKRDPVGRFASPMTMNRVAKSPESGERLSVTGQSAVTQSRAEKEYANDKVLIRPDEYLRDVRTVGAKTFQLKNGVWTDTDFNERANLTATTVKFGAEEYFKLVTEQPRLAEFFSVGERVIVVFKGEVYRVE